MAAMTAPARIGAQHQSLLHFVGEGRWSDAKVLEMVLPQIERDGPIAAWIIDDTSFPKRGRHSAFVPPILIKLTASRPQEWLLMEWSKDEKEPTKYWLSTLAGSGYCSEANLASLEARGVDAYVAAGRAKHPTAGGGDGERTVAMGEKIAAGGHESPYRLSKQLPESVFGQIKQARGFRQFLLRGIDNVRAECTMVCTAHNSLKLVQGWSLSAVFPAAA